MTDTTKPSCRACRGSGLVKRRAAPARETCPACGGSGAARPRGRPRHPDPTTIAEAADCLAQIAPGAVARSECGAWVLLDMEAATWALYRARGRKMPHRDDP